MQLRAALSTITLSEFGQKSTERCLLLGHFQVRGRDKSDQRRKSRCRDWRGGHHTGHRIARGVVEKRPRGRLSNQNAFDRDGPVKWLRRAQAAKLIAEYALHLRMLDEKTPCRISPFLIAT
jgi:hypothetical protein